MKKRIQTAGESESESEPSVRVASEVRYPLPTLLAEIRGEASNRAMGLEHLSQDALQSLFRTFKKRHERSRS